jgi:hypothetical protein
MAVEVCRKGLLSSTRRVWPIDCQPLQGFCVFYYYFSWGSKFHSYYRNGRRNSKFILGGSPQMVLQWSSGKLTKMGVGTPIFGSLLTKNFLKIIINRGGLAK